MKTFIRFSKQFFLQKDFIDTKNRVLIGRQKFLLLNYWKWSKKSPQKLHKLFKNIFIKKFPWRRRKQHESPAYFFRQPAELFPLDFQKTLVCKFSQRISPEKFHWNWESTFWQLRYLFCKIWSKLSVRVQKGEKK